MAKILDGKTLAQKITNKIKEEVSSLEKKPKLAVVLVGNNPASEIYVKNKEKKALELGFESIILPLPADISEENLLEHIYILNEDINILRKSPINIVRNDVIYNYKEEVEIPKSVLTNDSGRLYFVALFLMTNEDNDFNPEVFDCLFNIENFNDIEKIEDDFDLQLYTGIAPIVFDYKIVDNKIVFEYVEMDYKTY